MLAYAINLFEYFFYERNGEDVLGLDFELKEFHDIFCVYVGDFYQILVVVFVLGLF